MTADGTAALLSLRMRLDALWESKDSTLGDGDVCGSAMNEGYKYI